MQKGNLYLIPNTLGDSPIEYNLPQTNIDIIRDLKFFIVENIRTARRFLKKVDRNINIDELTFFLIDKHTKPDKYPSYLVPAQEGHSIGVLSEAGCPGVADPGADVVKIAHKKNIRIIPLIGPSSILLSLMASGMNGQNFAFVGYLPVKKGETAKAIRDVEQRSIHQKQTQIFIEAPYRNAKLLQDILSYCKPQTQLCIACDITLETEFIVTKTIAEWKGNVPDINKRPTIFLIQG
ncbi:MAG: SAM-dependent methyltransferase [Chlorobi bacterium]|nr:SAM-dependent methyltransferase [Chlorobiota bacterium]